MRLEVSLPRAASSRRNSSSKSSSVGARDLRSSLMRPSSQPLRYMASPDFTHGRQRPLSGLTSMSLTGAPARPVPLRCLDVLKGSAQVARAAAWCSRPWQRFLSLRARYQRIGSLENPRTIMW